MNSSPTYPLTRRQRLVLLSQDLFPETPVFHLVFQHRIFAKVSAERFESAFTGLILNTDALRTVIKPDGQGGHVTRIRSGVPSHLVFHDVSMSPDPESAMRDEWEKAVWSEFDLAVSPYASCLFKLDAMTYVWALKIHHVIFDGVSAQLLFERLEQLYRAPDSLPRPPQFGDYARARSKAAESDTSYWRDLLSTLDSSFEIYGERPEGQLFEVESFNFQFPENTSARFSRLVRECSSGGLSVGANRCAVLIAILGVFLSKAAQSKQAAIALTHHGRRGTGASQIIGLFTQVLPVIFTVDPQSDFHALLKAVRVQLSETLSHPDYTFVNPANEHLVNVGLNYRVRRYGRFLGKQVETQWLQSNWSEYGLSLDAIESNSGPFTLVLRIAKEMLSGWQRQSAARQFFRLLEDILDHPDQAIGSFSLLSVRQKQQMEQWNETAYPYPHDQTLHRLFEQQVERAPHSVALIENRKTISYRELNQKANRFAHYLIHLGVEKGDLVGLLMPRSTDMVMSLLAILKAGAAYLPLDIDDPSARIQTILSEASAPLLIFTGESNGRSVELPGLNILDLSVVDLSGQESLNPEIPTSSDDLLNCLFTSGSSGPPKGVLGTHRGAVNVVSWLLKQFPFEPGEVACLKTTYCFVDFVWELFTPLLAGKPTVLAPEVMVRDPRQLLAFLSRNKVSRLVLVPALLNILIHDDTEFDSLRWCFVGGEPLTHNLALRFSERFPDAVLVNNYGSTEGTGVATFWECNNEPGTPPIGRPIFNTSLRILDSKLGEVPIGAWGELCVGGASLAKGYLNNSSLTAEKFIEDPVTGEGVLYRTGDLARYLPDGNIECRGRIDRQLKIRGIRIEPGEIEDLLGQHVAVLSARVEATAINSEAKQIVAWIVFSSESPPKEREIRRFLRERLPAYMMPAHLVFLPEWPVNSRGKIDIESLRAKLETSLKVLSNDVVPSELEQMIIQCWEKYLPGSRFQPNSDFFDAGGDSLLAAQVMAALERQLGCQIPLGTMMKASTPGLLAEAIDENVDNYGNCSAVRFQQTPSGRTLFLLPTIGGALFRYRHLLRYLPGNLSVSGLQINRLKAGPAGEMDFNKIALELHEVLKKVQPRGPYLLAGFCFGGVLALELARLIESDGEQVLFLGLIETWAPGFLDRRSRPGAVNVLDHSNLLARVGFHAHALRLLRGEERAAYIGKLARRKLASTPELNSADNSAAGVDHLQSMEQANLAALRSYTPNLYQGDVMLYRAHHSWRREKERDLGWSPWLKGKVEIVDVPGFHTFVLEEPWVRDLGKAISAALAQAS